MNDLRETEGEIGHGPAPWAWILLGALAAWALALTGSRVGPLPGSGQWWLGLPHNNGGPVVMAGFYAAMAAMVGAWMGLAGAARRGRIDRRLTLAALGAWGPPLLVGPPLFSRDVYSYMAQGLLADRGLSPYAFGPHALGHGLALASVAHPWRNTPAPYGPLFVGLCRAASWAFGRSVVVEVTVFRLLAVAAVAVLVICLPRLARQVGVSPGRALWLGVLSPLCLFSFVASGHNDGLMVALLVLAATLALDGRTHWALVAASGAATIKVSAGVALVLLLAWAWRTTPPGGRRRAVGTWALAAVGPMIAISYLSGLGWGWLSPRVLAVPTKLLVGFAPAPAMGLSIFHGLRLVGWHVPRGAVLLGVESAFGLAVSLLALALAAGLARNRSGRQPRAAELPERLGILLLALVLAGPSLWPWYLTWSVVILSASRLQSSWAVAAVAAGGAFLVAPAGTPVLRGPDYLVVTGLIILAAGWVLRTRGWRRLWRPLVA